MQVAASVDIIQEVKGPLTTPEIRVWCHPHRAGDGGDDYYKIFNSFKEAIDFIEANKELAEEVPLIAFRGYEINLFSIPFKRKTALK